MKHLNRKGFTLIEIIVVIVILAVLMAVAVPAVLNYIHEADDAKRITEAKSVLTASEKYLVQKYNQERQSISKEIVGTFSEDERKNVVSNVKGNGELIRLSYLNGVVQKMTYFVDGRYVVFLGYNNKFIVTDQISSQMAEEVMFNADAKKIMIDFLKDKSVDTTIDSEAGSKNSDIFGYANEMNQLLKKAGFDIDQMTWQIQKLNAKNGQTRYQFLVTDQKLTKDMHGQSITVMKYIYYEDGTPDKSVNANQESNFDVEVQRRVIVKKQGGTEYPSLGL